MIDCRGHSTLEAEISSHATGCGWLVASATYHDVMPEPMRIALARCYAPAALYVRFRADRIAVREQCCIPFEVKTTAGARFPVAALPLSHHVRQGIPVLYVLRHLTTGREWAFWTHKLPAFCEVVIPDAWSERMRDYFTQRFYEIWPAAYIGTMPKNGGSNHPLIYFTFDALDAASIDWRQVFSKGEAT
jgi:hypothetical protein